MTYSKVRAETHAVRRFLMLSLAYHNPQVVALWDDGTDLVSATLANGQEVVFYLVDDPISLHEVQKMLRDYSAAGQYLMLMFWAHMLLPSDGQRYVPQAWMAACLALYGDRIYAYEVSSKQAYIFPIHFVYQTDSRERLIQWGKTVRMANLRAEVMAVESAYLSGQFHMAHFTIETQATDRVDEAEIPFDEPIAFAQRTALTSYYAILGLSLEATSDEVRTAYRAKAREYHPDLNPDAEAKGKMQEINQAYAQIVASWE